MDKHLEKAIINQYMDMKQLVESVGKEIAPNGTLYCPFHDNTKSKAAHYYENDGGGCIFCFAEHRVFTPYDFYKELFPEFDTTQLAQKIFDSVTPKEQAQVKDNVNVENELPELPYQESLLKFRQNKITYGELLDKINEQTQKDPDNAYLDYIMDNVVDIDLEELNNKYSAFKRANKTQYKVVFAHEIIKKVNIPTFLHSYLTLSDFHIMLPTYIKGRLINVSFRTLGDKKQFLKCGDAMYLPYNLGNLGDDFKYGTPILLVEGSIDCDIIREIYPYTIASLTAMLSTNQIQLLKHLTDKIIVAYDNDYAGDNGYIMLKNKVKDLSFVRFKHYSKLKDFGDLYELRKKDTEEYQYIINTYKTQIETFL